MAISTQDAVKARRRAYNWMGAIGGNAESRFLLSNLFQTLQQSRNNPDLQVVEFTASASADTVIADAACKIYAILAHKPTTTASWLKGSDSATTASATAGEVTTKQAAVREDLLLYPAGFPMANGFTIRADTTAAGSSRTLAADLPTGFVLLGKP